MTGLFKNLFKQNNKIYDGEQVYLKKRSSAFSNPDSAKTIYYDIILKEDHKAVGYADIRLEKDDESYFYGDIGYHIYKDHRGHHYAYYACLILFKIAKEEYGFKELIITCSPNNIASYKTLSKLNGEHIETVEVPKYTSLYRNGETEKCIFKYQL